MSSKRIIQFFICVVVAMAFLAGPMAVSSQAGEKVLKLKFSTFLPPKHPAAKTLKDLAKELTESSKGKVIVKYYGASALGKAAEQYDIVVEGLADMALTC